MTAPSGKREGRGSRDPSVTTSGLFLPEIEGLRGLAIVLVVLFHGTAVCNFVMTWTGQRIVPPLALIRAGHTGVTLFFALSAFLLALPLMRRTSWSRADVVSFYRRRALRILPLYWAVIIIGGCLAASRWSDMYRIVPYLTFLNGFWPFPQVSPYTEVTWSLATEVQFYLLLPLLPWVIARPVRAWGSVLLAVVAYGALIDGFFMSVMGTPGWKIGSTIIGRGPIFGCGIAAAWIYVRYGARLRSSWVLRAFGDVALVACFVLLELYLRWFLTIGELKGEFPPYVAWHAVEGVLWTFVLLLVVSAPLRLRRLIVNPVMLRLGLLSYSIYLLHWPLLLGSRNLLKRTWANAGWDWIGAAWLIATVLVLLLLSELTYRFVELPFLRRKARMALRESEDSRVAVPALDAAGSA